MEQDLVRRLHVVVHGHVQGVGFRYFTLRRAEMLGLTGWVRNCQDGTVEVVAEGRTQELETLLAALHTGPSGAVVRRVEVSWLSATGEFRHFEIA
ncbi:MAG: acylphosphatase [Thermoflexales bacterium]